MTNIADGQRREQNVQLAKHVGMEDYERHIAIYPNPARDIVNVEVSGGKEITGIELYDIHGRIVETFSETFLHQAKLNVSGRTAGTYFLHICTSDGREAIRKVVVSH